MSKATTSEIEQRLDEQANPKRPIYQKILVILTMMSVIGGSLTGLMTFVNNGFTEFYFSQWGTSFLMALVVMMPSALLMMTLLTKLVHRFFPNLSKFKENMLIGLIMAMFMESIMAGVSSFNSVGVSDLTVFFATWLQGFIYSLPLGVVIAVVMTITIKPKLQKFMAS